jgi:hypothetical protein
MPRFLQIDQEIIPGDSEVIFELSPAETILIALEITLLLNGISDGVKIGTSTGPYIELTVNVSEKWAKAAMKAKNRIAFEIGKNQVEYLQMTLLRAYRDKVAEVNHVHIDGTLGEKEMNLTVMFKESAPPMSGEDAKRIFGL